MSGALEAAVSHADAVTWFGDSRKTFVTSPGNSFLFIWRSENSSTPLGGGVALLCKKEGEMIRTTLSVTVFVAFVAVMFGLAFVPELVDSHFGSEGEQVAVVE